MSNTVQHTCCSHTDSSTWGYSSVQTQQQHLWLRGVSKPTPCWSQWLHHKCIAHHILSSHSDRGSGHCVRAAVGSCCVIQGRHTSPKTRLSTGFFVWVVSKQHQKVSSNHVDKSVHNCVCITSEQHVDNFSGITAKKLSTACPHCQLAPTNLDSSARSPCPSRRVVLRTYALIIAFWAHFVKRVFHVCGEKATVECGARNPDAVRVIDKVLNTRYNTLWRKELLAKTQTTSSTKLAA